MRGFSASSAEIACHSSSVSASGTAGSMARRTYFQTNAKSRQVLRGRGWPQCVPPRGKCARVMNQLLHKQRRHQLAAHPGLGTVVIVFRQAAQLCQRLESLEHQLDLPSRAIPLQHGLVSPVALRHRGELYDVLGQLQRGRLDLASLVGRLPADPRMDQADGLLGRAQRADPPLRRDALAGHCLGWHGPNDPGSLQRLRRFPKI